MGSYSANSGTWANKTWSSQNNSYSSKLQSTQKQPSQAGKHKNGRKNYESSRQRRDSSRSDYSQCSRQSSASDSLWGDADSHFPTLAPPPEVNVWEVRRVKAEEIKALEPHNRNEEDKMLQYALKLSKLEAKEKEIERKLEEEYRLQNETLKIRPELLKEIPGLEEEYYQISDPGFQSVVSPPNTPWSEDLPVSNQRMNSNPASESLSSSSYHSAEDLWPVEDIKQPVAKKQYCNSGGAKLKMEKVIDTYGGWGLKNQKEENKSELLEFVDHVIKDGDLAVNKTNHAASKNDKGKCHRKIEKVKDSFNLSNFKLPEPTEIKSSSKNPDLWADDVIYDGKGTFTDVDDDKNVHTSAQDNNEHTSWYDACMLDELKQEANQTANTLTVLDDARSAHGCADVCDSNYESVETDNFKLSDCEKTENDSSNKNEPFIDNQFNDKSNYQHNETAENSSYSSKHETLNHSKADSFGNGFIQSSNLSQSIVENEFDCKTPSSNTANVGFQDDPQLVSELQQNEMPPILPPQPTPRQPFLNRSEDVCNNTTQFPGNLNLPYSLGSQFAVPFQPTFPFMNPVFPDPAMMSFNPIMARQMLMLSNPYFATQLLAIEQHYKTQAIQAGAFPMHPLMMPNMNPPGVVGSPLELNAMGGISVNHQLISSVQSQVQSTVIQMGAQESHFQPGQHSANQIGALQSQFQLGQQSVSQMEALQSQFQSDQLSANQPILTPESAVGKSYITPPVGQVSLPGINADVIQSNSSALSDLDANDDYWFRRYFSNDNSSVIPPPMPPSNSTSTAIASSKQLSSVPSVLSDDERNTGLQPHIAFPSMKNGEENPRALSNVQSCAKKVDEIGWGNLDKCTNGGWDDLDKSASKCTNDGWGDIDKSASKCVNDGWGDLDETVNKSANDGWDIENIPVKPIKSNAMTQDNRRRPMNRQPESKPQFTRYQQNWK